MTAKLSLVAEGQLGSKTVSCETDLIFTQSDLIKKAQLKLSWLEAYVYDCLKLEAEEQDTDNLNIDITEFIEKYQFIMGGKVILTHQTIVEAINAIDKKSGIQINNPPEIIQLTLF